MAEATFEVLIPYVGRVDYLRTAVTSLLVQSDTAWRLTVVEDGDQGENAAEWLRELRDPRITHVLNPRPLRLAGNFQRCLDLATADYVVFAGCDDAFLPDYVSTCRRLVAKYPRTTAVLPAVRVMDAQGVVGMGITDRVKSCLAPRKPATGSMRGEQLLASLMRGNWTYFPSICWRREAIAKIGFRQDLPTTLDLCLLSELLLNDHEVVVDRKSPRFLYRRHGMSASSMAADDSGRFVEERELFAELESACRRKGWTRAATAARWHVTSRLHAAMLLPRSLGSGNTRNSLAILRHLFSAAHSSTATSRAGR